MSIDTPSLTAEEREELVALRRDFHRHPELSLQEERTARVVADAVREASAGRGEDVAAVNVAEAGGGAFTPAADFESFSSDGPRRMFFDAAGNTYTPGDYSSTGGELGEKAAASAKIRSIKATGSRCLAARALRINRSAPYSS
mgnify:CR=1 FL=1